MAQLKEDEWPDDREPTTTEHEAEVDPINGPKDPDRPVDHAPDSGASSSVHSQNRTAQLPTARPVQPLRSVNGDKKKETSS